MAEANTMITELNPATSFSTSVDYFNETISSRADDLNYGFGTKYMIKQYMFGGPFRV